MSKGAGVGGELTQNMLGVKCCSREHENVNEKRCVRREKQNMKKGREICFCLPDHPVAKTGVVVVVVLLMKARVALRSLSL